MGYIYDWGRMYRALFSILTMQYIHKKIGLGNDPTDALLRTSNFIETRKMSMVVRGIQTEMLEEHILADCDKQINNMTINVILDDIVSTLHSTLQYRNQYNLNRKTENIKTPYH